MLYRPVRLAPLEVKPAKRKASLRIVGLNAQRLRIRLKGCISIEQFQLHVADTFPHARFVLSRADFQGLFEQSQGCDPLFLAEAYQSQLMVVLALLRIDFDGALDIALGNGIFAHLGVQRRQVEVGRTICRVGAHNLLELLNAFEDVAFVQLRQRSGEGISREGICAAASAISMTNRQIGSSIIIGERT